MDELFREALRLRQRELERSYFYNLIRRPEKPEFIIQEPARLRAGEIYGWKKPIIQYEVSHAIDLEKVSELLSPSGNSPTIAPKDELGPGLAPELGGNRNAPM